jgi:hypothetical protein
MGFFIFGLGIIIASQNLQIDITPRVLWGWAFFCVGFKRQVGSKHGYGVFPGVLIDKMHPPMHGLGILSLGFERQDVPKHGRGLVSHGSETRWTQASTFFRRLCDACWLKDVIPLNRFTWLLIKLDFASYWCMRLGGWLKDFQHLNTISLMPGIIQEKKGPKWYYGQQAPFCTMKWDQYWSCWAWSMSFCPVLADSSRAYSRAWPVFPTVWFTSQVERAKPQVELAKP